MQIRTFLLSLVFLCTVSGTSLYQKGFDNGTRALYIMDISQYVQWPAGKMLPAEEFSIAVLSKSDSLYWELENLAKNRKFIQGKPARIYLFRDPEHITPGNVLFVNAKEGYKLNQVLDKIKGNNTLLISEGYQFRESMLNFIVIDGKPRFEVNEQLLNSEGLKVDELFLAQAVKTREDWEGLFKKTETELIEEKEITRQQKELIDLQAKQIEEQQRMIAMQLARLDSLDREIKLRQADIKQKEKVLTRQVTEIRVKETTIKEQAARVNEQQATLNKQEENIKEREAVITRQTSQISQQEARIISQLEEIEKKKLAIYFISLALILVIGLVYFVYVNYRNKKKANIILEEKNRLITEQKEEIRQQRDLAELQRDQIAYQKKHITDSIEYAKRIQRAILPSLELFSEKLDHFVLYKPRDIVSGDFYWVDEVDGKQVIITADCTGHGVPGAFMSMLGVSLLNEIVNNKGIHRPDLILNELRANIISSLKQYEGQSDVKDGMDMTVCTISSDRKKLEFAGANNPLFLVRNGEIIQYKPDKMPVAIYDNLEAFSLQTIELEKGDTFYTFSDGYADQFGGPSQKKFLIKNFREVILQIQNLNMYDQAVKLNEVFESWRSEVDQVDDVTVIGVRV